MKGISKAILGVSAAAVLAGCSSMVEVPERKSYAEPKWYAECAETGTEGMLWWSKDYVYACGGGQSRFFQAAEEQGYTIALNHFARRINGKVNSETSMEFENGTKQTKSVISHSVTDTSIRRHVSHERAKFKYAGEYYTFVRLKMERDVFEGLIKEARNEEAAANSANSNSNDSM
jgi:hypothetical protein